MPRHHRWWFASIAFIVAAALAGIWLEGEVRSVLRGALTFAYVVCGVVAFMSWFRWTQRDEAVRSPLEPEPIDPAARREAAVAVGALTLFLALSYVLRLAFADAGWFKPAMSVVVIAFWGLAAMLHLRRLGRSGDSG